MNPESAVPMLFWMVPKLRHIPAVLSLSAVPMLFWMVPKPQNHRLPASSILRVFNRKQTSYVFSTGVNSRAAHGILYCNYVYGCAIIRRPSFKMLIAAL